MKWHDIKDSTEFAEALSLAASLVAAVIALRDAQKSEKNAEDKEDESSSLPVDGIDLVPPIVELNIEKVGVKRLIPSVVVALSIVVTLQMIILLFIAWKVL